MKGRKLLSAIIAVAMVLGTMSFPAFAEGEVASIGDTTYTTLAAAVAAANANDTIMLIDDTTESDKVTITDKTINIDFDGHTLNGSILINGNSVVTVKDGYIRQTELVSGIEVAQNANVTINNMDVVSFRHAIRVDADDVNCVATAVVNGGKYVSTNNTTTCHGLNIGSSKGKSIVTVYDGEFYGPVNNVHGGNSLMVQNHNDDVKIYGGYFAKASGVEGCICPANGLKIYGTNSPKFETWGYDRFVADDNIAVKVNDIYTVCPTLGDAVAAAQDGDTITLLSDISDIGTVEISAEKNITIDLNGKTIAAAVRSDNANKHYYAIDNYGTLMLEDSVGGGTISARGIENFGNMTINGGTYLSIDKGNGGAAVWNEGNLAINDGTFKSTYRGSASDTYGAGCLNNSGTTLITGGTFEGTSARTYAIISTGDLIVTPGEGKEVNVSGVHGGISSDSGSMVINGGNYSSEEYYGLYVSNDGTGTDPQTAFVTVNGGTFSGKSYSVWIGSDYNDPVNSSIAINGGTFTKPINAQDNTRENAIVIKGGTFASDVSAFLADGYTLTANADGTYGVVEDEEYVAKIGNSYYSTLVEAVAAAQDGDTITLLGDAAGNGVIVPSGSNITIDLGGFTYNVDGTTVGSAGTETQAFQLLKNSNIIIKNGTITSNKALMLIQNYSNLTLEDVTLDGSNLPSTNCYVLSNNNGDTVLKGNTNIIAKDGDIAFDCCYWPAGGYGKVSVTLGTDFTGKITGEIEKSYYGATAEEANANSSISISGGKFTTDVSAFLADGYTLTANADGTYGVEEDTDPEILKRSLYVTYSQPGKFDFGSGEEDSIKLSLFAGVDSLNYSEVGFDVLLNGVTQTFPVKVVYDSVKVNMNGEVKTINASEFGKGVNHIFGQTINFPATSEFENASVKWTPYAIRNNVKITGNTFELSDIFPGTLEVNEQ